MLLISNNPYTLTDKLFDMGKRYTVDSGKLGIAGLSVTSQTELTSLWHWLPLVVRKNIPDG
ncbi:MAG: hypothetical protein M9928_12345 [Anaerolineae bacterium]|nr:hypothetical protein [Anaerolineae bacterium]